jgi:hypothetical protein
LLQSGVALSEDTIKDLFSIVSDTKIKIDANKIKNKEFLMLWHTTMGTIPTDVHEFIRYLVYTKTNKTLLIKNKKVRTELSKSDVSVGKLIKKFGIENLATVYHRYKLLLNAMKTKQDAKIFNRLTRLGKRLSVPHVATKQERLLSDPTLLGEAEAMAINMATFKLVTFIQSIRQRRLRLDTKVILVRNGRAWADNEPLAYIPEYHDALEKVLYGVLVKRMANKACKIQLNDNITLAVPTSEKNFVGDIPFGSTVEMPEDGYSIVGVHWTKDDGIRDIDLSFLDASGVKVGWNTRLKVGSVTHSGDIVNPEPEATELLKCANFPTGNIRVNKFSGEEGGRFRLFLATSQTSKAERGRMVNPEEIVFDAIIKPTTKESIVGLVSGRTFMFCNIGGGESAVSYNNPHYNMFVENVMTQREYRLTLKELLVDAGFELVTENPDIDLNVLDKSTLVDLLG